MRSSGTGAPTCAGFFLSEWTGSEKGASAIAGALNDRGVRTELTIVGSTPDVPPRMKDIVNVRGFISKDSPSGVEEMRGAL